MMIKSILGVLILAGALSAAGFCPLETGGFKVCLTSVSPPVAKMLPGYVPDYPRGFTLTGRPIGETDADEVIIELTYEKGDKQYVLEQTEPVHRTVNGTVITSWFATGEAKPVKLIVRPKKRTPVRVK